ncbi:MAG TPA: ABC transporter permease [Blastocatellia bacterium]|nr:ABC transporter permease [Blastocatellia bacterium]
MTTERGPNPLFELTISRVREFIREKEAVFWVFVFPVLLACALGIAFRNSSPERMHVAVEKNGRISDQLAEKLSSSEDLDVLLLEPAEAATALRTGKVAVVVGVPATAVLSSPATDLADIGHSDGVLRNIFDFKFDPTRPESRMARLAVDNALQRALGREDVAAIKDHTETEPGARYIDFLIPGLIGMNLMGSGMWGLGFVVVNARTRKLLKRLAATPMRRSHFLLSFMFSRLVFLVMEVVAVIAFAWVVFGVKVYGSLAALAVVALVGAMTFAGIGLLVASRPKTIEGVSGLMNLVMLPMWLLSGTFFASSRFPQVFQPFIKALPLTALNTALRSVMNDGAPLASSWAPLCIMLAWGLVSFVLALKLFRWQ